MQQTRWNIEKMLKPYFKECPIQTCFFELLCILKVHNLIFIDIYVFTNVKAPCDIPFTNSKNTSINGAIGCTYIQVVITDLMLIFSSYVKNAMHCVTLKNYSYKN